MPAQSAEDVRRALLRAGRRLLTLQHGQQAGQGPITVIVAGAPVVSVSTAVPPHSAAPPTPAGLPPLQRDILAAITDQPQSAEHLARQAGRHLNSSFYTALAALVEAGLARRTRRGYLQP